MMNMQIIKYVFFVICSSLLFAACGEEEELDQEDFIAAVSGKYLERMVFYGLKYTDEGWQEMDELPSGIPLGSLPILWFVDRDTVLTYATLDDEIHSAIPGDNSLSSRWSRYLLEKGENLTLFVRSGFGYDPLTGRFLLDNLSEGQEQGEYYIEKASGKEVTLKIELNEPVTQDIVGYRNIYQEQLSPDLRPDSPYMVFDSNEEAIAYVREVLGE